MAISKKVQQFMDQGSWIRRMFEDGIALKQQFGDQNVFDLSLGNPVIDPPVEFFSELKRIANDPVPGMHRYMPNAGYVETRAAVATQLREEIGLDFSAEDIIMTVGAGGALNVVFKTLLDPGDEVIIFTPYFVEYQFYADNHSGLCRAVQTDENFNPDLGLLERAITPKTRVVLVNSPNNPTGVVYNPQVIAQMSNVIQAKEREYDEEIFLVSDEPYRKILFDGIEFPQIFNYHVRSIVVTSHSKDLALPGERIGYIAVHPDYDQRRQVVDGLTFCNRTLGFVNAPALMQHIVRGLQSATVDVGQYQVKRDFLYERLTEMGYKVTKPQGAFYMFPKAPIEDEIAFVEELQRHNVLVVPGRGFGLPGYFRLSYCVDHATLEGSLTGFRTAMERFSSG